MFDGLSCLCALPCPFSAMYTTIMFLVCPYSSRLCINYCEIRIITLGVKW